MMYLYGRLRLPTLPTGDIWDKKAYPCAIVTAVKSFGYYSSVGIHLLPSLEVRKNENTGSYSIPYNAGGKMSASVEVDISTGHATQSQWSDFTLNKYSSNIALENVIWANTDIFLPDGTLYLAASDPVPELEDADYLIRAFWQGFAAGCGTIHKVNVREQDIIATMEDGVLHIRKAPATLNDGTLEVCKNV